MKKWPNKILITSEVGFERFKHDAIEYVEANDVICEPITTPDSYPCLIVGNTFSWGENDGRYHWKKQKLCLTYVYPVDFN